MQDGRILYSRWEYVDRPAIPIQSLWSINPDGTQLAGVFGNRVLSPATFMDAREIPGTDGKILCVLTAHNLTDMQDIAVTVTDVVESTPYETWAPSAPDNLFDDDKNGDGIPNGLAFLLGAVNATDDATGLLPVPTEDGSGKLVLTFQMLDSASRAVAQPRSTSSTAATSATPIHGPWSRCPMPAADPPMG